MIPTEQQRREQRAHDALQGRERARLYGRTPAGYEAILGEWIVPHRESASWQQLMIWRMDWRDVERFCDAMVREMRGQR
jgi:hypothetical protein